MVDNQLETQMTLHERREKALSFRMKQLDEKEAAVKAKYDHIVVVREEIREKYKATGDVMFHVIRLNLGHVEIEDDKKWVPKYLIEAVELSNKNKIRMWKRINTLDCLVTAKREQEAPLIDEEFRKSLIEEQVVYVYMQQQKVELSLLCHARDLQEKKRLARMLDNKIIFEKKIASKHEVERDRLQMKREEVFKSQKEERETKRKLLYYLKCEEEKLKKLNEACEKLQKKTSKPKARFHRHRHRHHHDHQSSGSRG